MAVWRPENILLTETGQELLSRVQAGDGQLTITKVVTGTGRVADSELFTQTAITGTIHYMTITNVTAKSSGSDISLQLTNKTGVPSAYDINQIGIYASHPSMGEVLYMIAQCNEGTADTMPIPEHTPVIMNFTFHILHDSVDNINVTIDPSGYVTMENYQELCDFVGYHDEDVYGVEIDFENNLYTRLGANEGLYAGADFDNILPWGGRKRCIVTDEGIVLAYYGNTAYTETGYLERQVTKNEGVFPVGTPVQVMVEQPKFWYKTVPVKYERISGQDGVSLLKARYYVSPTPKPGFKLFPIFSRGIPSKEVSNAVYFSAFRGSIYDPAEQVREEQRITINTNPTSAGIITIIPDIYADERIEVEVDPDMTTDNLVGQFERAISNYQSNIIATYGSFSNNILVRYKKAGPRSLIQIDTGDTGMVCTVAIYSDVGSGGYVESDAPVPAGLQGCMFSSVAGVKPASGGSHDLTRYRISELCKRRNISVADYLSEGFGWQQIDIAANMCTAYLFLIEYGSLDAYHKIGQGASNMTHYGTNQAIRNGKTSELGNTSGSVSVRYTNHPYTGTTYCVSYRGEENLWGNGSFYEEGINVYGDDTYSPAKDRVFVSTTGIYSDDTSDPSFGYEDIGFTLKRGKGYIGRVGYSKNFDWGFLPTNTGIGNRPIHDYFDYGSRTGWRVSYRANFWDKGQYVGLNSRYFSNISSNYNIVLGGRLMYIPDPDYHYFSMSG